MKHEQDSGRGTVERDLRAHYIAAGIIVPADGDKRGRAIGERYLAIDEAGRRIAARDMRQPPAPELRYRGAW